MYAFFVKVAKLQVGLGNLPELQLQIQLGSVLNGSHAPENMAALTGQLYGII